MSFVWIRTKETHSRDKPALQMVAAKAKLHKDSIAISYSKCMGLFKSHEDVNVIIFWG